MTKAPGQSAGPSKLRTNLTSYNDNDVSLKPKLVTPSNAFVAESTYPTKKVVKSNFIPSMLTSKNHHNGPKNRQQSQCIVGPKGTHYRQIPKNKSVSKPTLVSPKQFRSLLSDPLPPVQ